MPNWNGSDRRKRLPSDWPQIRRRVLARDGRRCCAALGDGSRCNGIATDVDHIVPNDDHSDDNLQSLCASCHRTKSGQEGAAAARAAKARMKRRFKAVEKHPGLI